MKKLLKSVLYLVLFVTTLANAQWNSKNTIKGNGNITVEKRNTAEYDEVNIVGFFDVELIAGKEGNLTITAEENLLSFIKTEVDHGALKIYIEKNKSISTRKKIVITIPFESINAVSLAGSGDVISKSTIKTSSFSAKLAGSGDLNLNVDATNVDSQLSGSGNVKISGKTTNLKASLAGSGDMTTDTLITANVDANVAGSGNVTVYCSNALKARVSGSGDIFYKGSPQSKDTKVNGSGNIAKR